MGHYSDIAIKCVGKKEMTAEQAKQILHPDTIWEALTEIKYYAGFNEKQAKQKAVDDACIVACEALEKQIPKKPYDDKMLEEGFEEYICPNCKAPYSLTYDGKLNFCSNCGQSLDW